MELHGYLDHGYRVLSHPDSNKTDPEILEHAEHVELPELDRQKVIDLKLEGNKGAELYRLLLVAQCNALHSALPFLFERVDDETELVLPNNLLHSDSIIRKLVASIDEEDWQEVEIIGWLYESYISERYEAVIGKVVASEDIPAATQRFTPKWIVKYLVQNTLGRQWLATYPHSPLRAQMKYYVEPAEQTPEVQEQLRSLTPVSLNPEEISLLDPACGSGHILVEAYDLFKAIYQERGYRARDIPALILRKNLFGLEIDDRAAQLAAFALVMKARADDRRILKEGTVQPNILALQESMGLDARDVTAALNAPILKEKQPPSEYLFEEIEDADHPLFSRKAMAEEGHVAQADVATLLELFEDAKTFGSLIRVPPKLAAELPDIGQRARAVAKHGNLVTQTAAKTFLTLVEQAALLARQFDAVVGNPPYMGKRGMNTLLKQFMKKVFPIAKADIYAAFILRGLTYVRPNRHLGLITLHNWMFTDTYEKLRKELLSTCSITSTAHLGPRAFEAITGEVVQTVAFCCGKFHINHFSTVVSRLVGYDGEQKESQLHNPLNRFVLPSQDDLSAIPGSPIAYWIPRQWIAIYRTSPLLTAIATTAVGLQTGENEKFLRQWHEINIQSVSTRSDSRTSSNNSGCRWFPHNKGGLYRKWYGNLDFVVDWERDGQRIKQDKQAKLKVGAITENNSKCWNQDRYFQEGVAWTDVGADRFGARLQPKGCVFDIASPVAFTPSPHFVLGLLNSVVASQILNALNPTLHFNSGNVSTIPVPEACDSDFQSTITEIVGQLVDLAKRDWDSVETSWDFQVFPILENKAVTVLESYQAAVAASQNRFRLMKRLEEDNNFHFIHAYDLQGELSPVVPDDQITLYRPEREEDMRRLLSYAIGCMMGRYSLGKPGLIYALSGNIGFDPGQYKTFPADDDGIVPLLETDWGIPDDVANRLVEFIGVAWPREHLEVNLKFIADSLGPAKDERPRDTIRRYLATGFFKDHLRWYKRRPIYWLFSSGKQRAFQASSICTATTRACWPGCGRNTSSRSWARSPPASSNWKATRPGRPRPRTAGSWKRSRTH